MLVQAGIGSRSMTSGLVFVNNTLVCNFVGDGPKQNQARVGITENKVIVISEISHSQNIPMLQKFICCTD
jgi:hypothetical protein